MGIFIHQDPLLSTFGITGNIFSFMVFMAPILTFIRICKKNSTKEVHQSLPYVTALLSSMLWIYYAYLKAGEALYLILPINALGCGIQTIYIIICLVYAPKKAKILVFKQLMILILSVFFLTLLLSLLLAKGTKRVLVVGWLCAIFSLSIFVAPLDIVRQATIERNVKLFEYMPFTLSFFLILKAVMWFTYGLLLMDLHIVLPNIVGFFLGVLQMVLYLIDKCSSKKVHHQVGKELQPQEQIIIDMSHYQVDASAQPIALEAVKEAMEERENIIKLRNVAEDEKIKV